MKLILYDDDMNVLIIEEGLTNPTVENNDVEWVEGKMLGIKSNFILVDDEVNVGEVIDDELLDLDKKKEFVRVDLVAENAKLKEELQVTALAFMEFAEMVMKGEI